MFSSVAICYVVQPKKCESWVSEGRNGFGAGIDVPGNRLGCRQDRPGCGLCRAAARRGIDVRPFKPQNMSNNAAVTAEGGEIGRGQWLQALACGVVPSVHMNPILLKPQTESGSQVVVHGKVRGQAEARDYQKLKAELLDAVIASFSSLRDEADLVLVEGAGSPAEVNLRVNDIANMGFCDACGCACRPRG